MSLPPPNSAPPESTRLCLGGWGGVSGTRLKIDKGIGVWRVPGPPRREKALGWGGEGGGFYNPSAPRVHAAKAWRP